MIKVVDNSKNGIYNSNMELVNSFTDYSSKNLDFDKPVTIELMDDEENAKNPLGTTAHYNPDEMKITIYVTGRHIKDILRSISHELIHHVQNCRGDLSGMEDTSLGYAQRDKHMRDMETEAFNSGNIMNFRDFEDNYKQRGHKMNKLRENRLKKLNSILTEGSSLLVEQGAADLAQTASKQRDARVEELKQRSGEYKGVGFRKIPGSRTFGRVGLRRDAVVKIADCKSPKSVGAYIESQVESSYVNDNELLLLTLGVESCKERKKLIDVLNYLNLDDTGPLYRYITKISMVTEEDLRKRIFNALRDSVKDATPEAPAKPREPEAPAKPGEPAVADRECTTVPFSKGCRGPKVGTIKRLIHFTTGMKGDRQKFARNEKFDNETEFMVKEFQKQNGLSDTGVVDKETFDKLLDVAVIKRDQQKGQAAPTAVATPTGVSAPTTSTVPSVPPPAVPMAGLPKMTRRQAIDTAMNMMRGRDRRFRGTAADLAGRTVYHFMTKGMSPEEAYAKTAEIFGAEGEKVKLGPVSRRNWIRGFLDQLDLIRLSELPELPAE